jgi:glycosyltransferase involved in cell wall biosynthesis
LGIPVSSTSIRALEIGIDGGTWSNRRGYGRFLRELLPEVVRLRPEWRFKVFLDRAQSDTIMAPNLQWISADTERGVSESAAAGSARSASDLWRMSRAVGRESLDLLFFPTVYSYFPVLRRLPVVVGIHDTMADRFPQWAFAGKKQELLWRAKVRLAMAQATRIVTVSEYSRATIAQHFSIDPGRMAVVSEAAASAFAWRPEPEEETILAVGGLSPNKNLGLLIRTLAVLRQSRPGLRLVLVGDYEKDGFRGCYDELRREAEACGVSEVVEFTGFITDEALASLYNRCKVFAMPSLEEGFGLPLVEAMSCGCACAVSSGHALEEVGGDAVVLADPHSVDDWARVLGRLLDDPARRAELREKARRRAATFTWERGAQTLVTLFEGLVRR